MTATPNETRSEHGDLELHGRVAAGRCDECGSPEVRASCSDCHQLMCAEHQGHRGPRPLIAELRVRLPLRSRLAISPQPTQRWCGECTRHIDLPWRILVAGTTVFVAGLVVVPWASGTGAAVALFGAAVACVASSTYALRWRQLRRRLDQRLRIEPGVTSISVVDLLEATVTLDDQQNHTVTPPIATGEVVVEAEWSDAARLRVLQDGRRRKSPDQPDLRYWAGAIVLRGPVGFDVTNESKLKIYRHAMLPLHGDVADHEFLRSPEGHGHRSWRVAAPYVITPEPDTPWKMPIWLTPSIAPGSDRRILDLDIQWAKFGPGKKGLALGSIEKLRIDVPDEWGPVLGSTNYALVSINTSKATGYRRVEWRPISNVPHFARGRHRISLRFEGQVRPTDAICGEMIARFRGNLCRIKHVDLHGPDGDRRERINTTRLTRVKLEFDLSLAAVDYEAIRVLPRHADPMRPDGSDRPEEVFDRVVPDSATLACVMGALSEGDYYVKRVVENPPQPGRTESVVNRYWDLSGRKYDGLYPIDFHLILSGQELHDGGQVTAGRTEMALSIRGAYADKVADQLVHEEWNSLRVRIVRALEASTRLELRRWSAGSTRDLLARLVETLQISPQAADRLESAIHDEFGQASQPERSTG